MRSHSVKHQFVQKKLITGPRNHYTNFTADGADAGECRQIIIRPFPPIDHSGFPTLWTFPVDSRADVLETDSQKTGAGPPAGTPAAWESGCVKASPSVSGCSSCQTTQVVSQSYGRGGGIRIRFDALEMTKIRRVEHLYRG
jgi:hypothetical protein